MNIEEIYCKYEIPPWLAKHMRTVAAVAASIFDAHGLFMHRDELISACLLHDMGNILKFDLDNSPVPLNENAREHWKNVQKKMREKYGTDTHSMTHAIAGELCVSARTGEILSDIGFKNAEKVRAAGDIFSMIAVYADMRVSPGGVTSLEERLSDLRERYAKHKERADKYRVERLEESLQVIEEQLFVGLSLRPEHITDAPVARYDAELEHFEIL